MQTTCLATLYSALQVINPTHYFGVLFLNLNATITIIEKLLRPTWVKIIQGARTFFFFNRVLHLLCSHAFLTVRINRCRNKIIFPRENSSFSLLLFLIIHLYGHGTKSITVSFVFPSFFAENHKTTTHTNTTNPKSKKLLNFRVVLTFSITNAQYVNISNHTIIT